MKTALCAVSTLLAAMAVLYASAASDGKKREMALNAVYQRAFYETCEYVSGMENDLSKLNATSSARTQVSLLDDLSRRAQGAQCNLALLPVSMDAATATMKFVNQAGDYAETLSARLSAGGTLGEEDRAQLGVLSESASLFASRLDEALTGVVEDCVNGVGVDVNIASPSLLSYVSGLTRTTAKNIVAYREENGAFTTRAQLKKVPRLGPKAFEQCAGFLRIPGGKDLIENTGVHPESYDAARALLKHFSLTPAEAVGKLLTLADAEGFAALAKQLNVGEPTLRDIAAELSRPGRDPRDELPQVLMRSDVMDLKDLQPGMELRGTVRNVTDFGAFVDIGVHRDGLVHISQMAQRRVNHPSEVVRVGDIVTVWVLEADAKTNRISLTMRPPAKGEGNFSTTKSTQTKKLT